MSTTKTLSTAEARRDTAIDSAVEVFARTGYLGTPVAAVAEHARISTAYVFKLFPSKESLFVAALDRCFDRIVDALEAGAHAETVDQSPTGILDAMGAAYAELIADRSLIMLQVHAQSATTVPEIAAALRAGLERVTEFASTRSGASDAAVQRFLAYGQLCHLIVTAGIDGSEGHWAEVVSAGISHPSPR
ncbi:TetR family transcriptional regulator [Frondihabitans sp. PAMC 28766]|uniref:TetR/AcrR family transcriptional regulator n=1 Tax=Frondihabitans sp. PAMC 28766 TaxID=1795630 RepID=UPI00078C90BF|nr:helix-turn-helix domain-containing protein [Frondihabitans sp. PAMC 28766]AMM19004.1 TetR family transcriptional regulator [Frondihabitans sp. PAMC 28766]